MTQLSRALVDTSVLIAVESGRPLDPDLLPQESALSVVTIAELQAGVLGAPDTASRARRLKTLDAVSDVAPIPIDTAVAAEWARLRVELATAGRRAGVNDLWIAASARSHGLPVVTQDADFDVLAELGLLEIIRV